MLEGILKKPLHEEGKLYPMSRWVEQRVELAAALSEMG
jgi:hypothetical protein